MENSGYNGFSVPIYVHEFHSVKTGIGNRYYWLGVNFTPQNGCFVYESDSSLIISYNCIEYGYSAPAPEGYPVLGLTIEYAEDNSHIGLYRVYCDNVTLPENFLSGRYSEVFTFSCSLNAEPPPF